MPFNISEAQTKQFAALLQNPQQLAAMASMMQNFKMPFPAKQAAPAAKASPAKGSASKAPPASNRTPAAPSAAPSTGAFDWATILAQQPNLMANVAKAQAPAVNKPTTSASSGAKHQPNPSAAGNLAYELVSQERDFPPGLPRPDAYNPDYSIMSLFFMFTLWDLLKAVSTTFPECKETVAVMEMLETKIHPDPKMVTFVIGQYHAIMRPYFAQVEAGDTSFLANADEIPFFSELKMMEKLQDPDLDAEDIQSIMMFIDQLNALSDIQELIPAEIFDVIYQSAFSHLETNGTPSGPPQMGNEETIQMAMGLLSKMPPQKMMELFSDSERIKKIAKNFGKLQNLPGMENFGQCTSHLLAMFDSAPDML